VRTISRRRAAQLEDADAAGDRHQQHCMQIQTTTRTWRFTNGRVEQDTMRRRFWNPELLAQQATQLDSRSSP
jgi:hypothetical protein